MEIVYRTKPGLRLSYNTVTDKVTIKTRQASVADHYTAVEYDRHDLVAIIKAIELEALHHGHRPVLTPGDTQ